MIWAEVAAEFLLASALGAVIRVRRMSFLVGPWFLFVWLAAELPVYGAVSSLVTAGVLGWMHAHTWALASAGVACVMFTWIAWRTAKNHQSFSEALGSVLQTHESCSLHVGFKKATMLLDPWPVEWLIPSDVERIGNLSYGPKGRRNKLDIYRPRVRSAEKLPILLQIHGGGWCVGNKRQQARPLMHAFAQRGWMCIAINYRLSPWATFPDHVIDVKRAIAWIKANVEIYGGDPARIVVTGGSAGAHLTALTGLTANDPRFQPGFEHADTRVTACVPLYGVYDLLDRHGDRRDSSLRWLVRMLVLKKHPKEREHWELASPFSHVHPGAPPFFVVHGTHDVLAWVEEARRFVSELKRVSKAPVLYAELNGAQHAFELFRSMRSRHTVLAIEAFARWAVTTYSSYPEGNSTVRTETLPLSSITSTAGNEAVLGRQIPREQA